MNPPRAKRPPYFPRPPASGKKVRMRDFAIPDGLREGIRDMLLPAYLAKFVRPIRAIESRVLSLFYHRSSIHKKLKFKVEIRLGLEYYTLVPKESEAAITSGYASYYRTTVFRDYDL